ncbi:MAG: hypothetical protein JWQ38_2308 [Flavipsychrobacter sp.]|nr:hypothetical protein [Flavipsychrobacter sp.]
MCSSATGKNRKRFRSFTNLIMLAKTQKICEIYLIRLIRD